MSTAVPLSVGTSDSALTCSIESDGPLGSGDIKVNSSRWSDSVSVSVLCGSSLLFFCSDDSVDSLALASAASCSFDGRPRFLRGGSATVSDASPVCVDDALLDSTSAGSVAEADAFLS